MSTVKVNAITDASGGNTTTINSMTPTADSLQGFRNRIINGDMRIDQRGSASTPITQGAYSVDRWITFKDTDGSYTAGQSAVAPTGYKNSYLLTVTGVDSSIAAGQYVSVAQRIEGFNVADLQFGTASAKTVTISFWVRSSVTGTFSGAIGNGGATRSYSFDYTISAANTWEQKTVTISGDTSGTWATDNTTGLYVCFGLALGSSWTLATGSWSTRSGGFFAMGSPNQTNLMATNGATFYITGVQLEVGSIATPFERRPYGTELMLCQRYFYSFDTNELYAQPGSALTTDNSSTRFWFPVTMRAAPTATRTGTVGGSSSAWTLYNNGAYRTVTSITLNNLNTGSFRTEWATSSGVAGSDAVLMYCFNGNGGATLTVSAEL